MKNHLLMKEFESISPMTEIVVDRYHVTLCHYPMIVWNQSHRGALQFFGHVHSNKDCQDKLTDNQYNVSCEVLDYAPAKLEEIIAYNQKWRQK